MENNYILTSDGELYHWGVKGMKWGVRRYQNKNGSLTPAGKKRYADKLEPSASDSAVTKRVKNDYNKMSDKEFMRKYQTTKKTYAKRVEKYGDPYMNSPMAKYGKKQADKKKMSADEKERASRKNDLKNRRTMSDADLKKKIERLKMEKEFKNLTNEDIRPGKTFVNDVMSSAGKKALTIAAAGAMAYGVKVAMTGKFDIGEAANYIAANPNKKK